MITALLMMVLPQLQRLQKLPNVPVTAISISPKNLTVAVGENFELTAEVQPENATDKKVTWVYDKKFVELVSENDTSFIGKAIAEITGSKLSVVSDDSNATDIASITIEKPQIIKINSYVEGSSTWISGDYVGDTVARVGLIVNDVMFKSVPISEELMLKKRFQYYKTGLKSTDDVQAVLYNTKNNELARADIIISPPVTTTTTSQSTTTTTTTTQKE
ncbi:Ig-like domain-containing protein [Enterococcus faecium]|uniref:Ig-like domain-containing protein n=1 Tax=Enterococcus faecium TaxID=1352 RepID=UPI00128FCFC5|nr:immunoglobulin-like domain-containing protein [Enterococcus faecium]